MVEGDGVLDWPIEPDGTVLHDDSTLAELSGRVEGMRDEQQRDVVFCQYLLHPRQTRRT